MLGLALVYFQPSLAAVLLTCGEVRQEQLFRSWEKAKADTRSLVVDFTLEHTNRVRDEKWRFEGTVKLLRTAKGELLASYTLVPMDKPGEAGKPVFAGLLVGGALYLLNADAKTALRIDPANGDVRLWLEEKFNPSALLLDEKRARANGRCHIARLDQWYTYMDVIPPPSGYFNRGRAVFMNKDGDGVPKDMPCQLWYEEDGVGDCYTFDIRRWKANAADGPKAEEFTRPEDRPGWEVIKSFRFPWGAKLGAKRQEPARKVGVIYIVGNDITYSSAFLDLLGLYAASPFTKADLRAAERRLTLLWLLGIRCSVTTVDRAGDNEYVDILVRAKESPFTQIAGRAYNAVRNWLGFLETAAWYLKLITGPSP
jgi:hypothetical protein